VIRQARVGLVAAYLGVGVVEPEVGHMPQHMALAILRDWLAQMRTEGPVGDRGLADGVLRHRQAAKQVESAAEQQLAAHRFEAVRDSGHREVLDVHLEDVLGACIGSAHDSVDLSELLRGEHMGPCLGLCGQISAQPGLFVVENLKVGKGIGRAHHGSPGGRFRAAASKV